MQRAALAHSVGAACRYHTLGVALTLSALSRIPGQPLLTTLPGAFVVLSSQQMLSPAQAAALPLAAAAVLQGGVAGSQVQGQLNGASVILGNIQVGRRGSAGRGAGQARSSVPVSTLSDPTLCRFTDESPGPLGSFRCSVAAAPCRRAPATSTS